MLLEASPLEGLKLNLMYQAGRTRYVSCSAGLFAIDREDTGIGYLMNLR